MLTAHELFGFMSADLAKDILSFAFETDKQLYRTTLGAVADLKKVRPIFLERQSRQQRHESMIAMLSRPAMEVLSSNLIRLWLLKKHPAMLIDFLDGLGIPHKDGVVDDLPKTVEDEKLRSSVETLLSKYPHETVAVYLSAFNDMNEANWPNLQSMLETDKRLQFGNA